MSAREDQSLIRTHVFACTLPKEEADALNAESGRVYSRTLIWHYRVYRRTGHWLSCGSGSRLEDALGGATTLHAHSRDAAQQAFYRACKTARVCRKKGMEVHYPHKRKGFRTTIWKDTGIRKRDGVLLLSRSRGQASIRVLLPRNLFDLPPDAFREARLVWDRAARRYFWHLVVEDGTEPSSPPGERVVGVDLGEVHPAALTDGEEAVVVSVRAMRANRQYTAKRLAALQRRQAAKVRGSRRWWRLQRRKNRFLAQQRRRLRDMEHKASRAVVEQAREWQAGTLVIGDVRDVANGKRLNTKSQQKVGMWGHGRMRRYTTYKAEGAGIGVELVNEAYTTQACPRCGGRHKPTGRLYQCPACGFVSHRDIVGSANILSRYSYGEVGRVMPPSTTKYRHPFLTGKRSPSDTGQVARATRSSGCKSREAAGL
jgi:putative transposase